MMDVNIPIFAVIYCIVVILLTADFLMNLIIGVFGDVFKLKKLENEK